MRFRYEKQRGERSDFFDDRIDFDPNLEAIVNAVIRGCPPARAFQLDVDPAQREAPVLVESAPPERRAFAGSAGSGGNGGDGPRRLLRREG
jgi:hypothetical protein